MLDEESIKRTWTRKEAIKIIERESKKTLEPTKARLLGALMTVFDYNPDHIILKINYNYNES